MQMGIRLQIGIHLQIFGYSKYQNPRKGSFSFIKET